MVATPEKTHIYTVYLKCVNSTELLIGSVYNEVGWKQKFLELHLFTMPLEYDVTQMLRYPAPQSIAGVKPEDFYTIPINMR